MSQPSIIANIHAKTDQVALVEAELQKLIPVTRSETGCLQYDLHQDNEDPAHFIFIESWETRELWQMHMNAPHLVAYRQATNGAVAEFTLNELSKIS